MTMLQLLLGGTALNEMHSCRVPNFKVWRKTRCGLNVPAKETMPEQSYAPKSGSQRRLTALRPTILGRKWIVVLLPQNSFSCLCLFLCLRANAVRTVSLSRADRIFSLV